MIQVIVPICIGFFLLAILLYWFLSGKESDKWQFEISDARTALRHLESGSATLALIDRIADQQDMTFVLSEKDRNLIALLNYERRAVALLWLRRMHQQVLLLMSFHVKSARSSAKLGPVVEFKLAFQFIVFTLIYCTLLTSVWLRGPFHTRQLAGLITIALTNFCAISQQALAIANARFVGVPRDAETRSPING